LSRPFLGVKSSRSIALDQPAINDSAAEGYSPPGISSTRAEFVLLLAKLRRPVQAVSDGRGFRLAVGERSRFAPFCRAFRKQI
jgi:hypothetical protein